MRCTGASLTFNFGDIVGASLANSVATWLATHRGLGYVGLCLTIAGVLTALALLAVVLPKQDCGTTAR